MIKVGLAPTGLQFKDIFWENVALAGHTLLILTSQYLKKKKKHFKISIVSFQFYSRMQALHSIEASIEALFCQISEKSGAQTSAVS